MKRIILVLILGAVSIGANAAPVTYTISGDVVKNVGGDSSNLEGSMFVMHLYADTDDPFDRNGVVSGNYFTTYVNYSWDVSFTGLSGGRPDWTEAGEVVDSDQYRIEIWENRMRFYPTFWFGSIGPENKHYRLSVNSPPPIDLVFKESLSGPPYSLPGPFDMSDLASRTPSIGLQSGVTGLAPYGITNLTYSASVVPVPAAVWLFGSALGMLGWMRRSGP